MRRKPILFDKVTKEHSGMGREVIGLIGTRHGVGVTYTGLMLAFYMGEELGRKTAYLECNESHDMILIQQAYEWSREEALSVSFHRVTCYREVSPERIAPIFGENYDCIICDFGIDLVKNREEFLRCGTKIVVGGRSEWDILKLAHFTDKVKTIGGSDAWLYFIPQADDRTVTRIRKEVVQKVWSVPTVEKPTVPSNLINRFFGKIF